MTPRPHVVKCLDALCVAAIGLVALRILLILCTGGYAVTIHGITLKGSRVIPPTVLLLVLLVLRFSLRHRPLTRDLFTAHAPALLFAICCVIYLSNGRTGWSGDTLPARYLPLSILREGNFDLDEFPFLYARGTPYYLRHAGGHYVSAYPVGAALLALPLYVPSALGPVPPDSRLFTDLEKLSAAVIVALSAVLLYCTLRRLTSLSMALLITAIYAFGTSSLSVSSQALWQHGPSQLALAAALYSLVRGRDEPAWVARAGFPLALAVICRPTDLLIAMPVSAYVLVRHRSHFAGFLLSGLPPVLFQLWYNAAYFDTPFRIQVPLQRGRFWTPPSWDSLAGILLSPGRGLFVYSPVFLFSVLGIGLVWRRGGDPLLRYVSVGVSFTILLYSMWGAWGGGFTYGPRLLADLAPILAAFLCPLTDGLKRNAVFKGLFVLAVVWSLAAHAIGSFWDDGAWNVVAWHAAGDAEGFRQRLWSWTDNQLVNAPPAMVQRVRGIMSGLPTSRGAPSRLSASYQTNLPPRVRVFASMPIPCTLEALNVGQALWLSQARADHGAVRLGWRWLRQGKVLAELSERVPMRYDVFPGQRYRFHATITPPAEPGDYTLELSLVSEHVVWFSDVGTRPVRLDVDVQATSP